MLKIIQQQEQDDAVFCTRLFTLVSTVSGLASTRLTLASKLAQTGVTADCPFVRALCNLDDEFRAIAAIHDFARRNAQARPYWRNLVNRQGAWDHFFRIYQEAIKYPSMI
jgi:hypothetical protein